MPCHLCEGRETIDSALRLQLVAEQTADVPPFLPLCRKHFDEANGALAEVRKTQSPPVIINLPGLRVGGHQGSL